jgi:ElaB/YqjD/DUF883 family membrane-anchored ribosome-binding protein
LETQRLLGQLLGRLESIDSALQAANEDAKNSRDKMHDALREIREHAQETRHRLESLERVVTDDVQPVVNGVLNWKSRAVGAAAVLGFVGTVVVFLVTQTKDLLAAVWQTMIGR